MIQYDYSIVLFALYGLYSVATDGVQKALLSNLIDKNKRGTGMGIYNSLIGITLLPASVIVGVLYDKVDNRHHSTLARLWP